MTSPRDDLGACERASVRETSRALSLRLSDLAACTADVLHGQTRGGVRKQSLRENFGAPDRIAPPLRPFATIGLRKARLAAAGFGLTETVSQKLPLSVSDSVRRAATL